MVTNTQIKKWNNYFNGLSPEEKRVAIAKDVIAQLKAEKIQACSGVYIDIEDVPNDGNISLQKYLPETQCEVCALGALFHSHIKYNNKVSYKDYLNESTSNLIVEKLQNYFSFEQMSMIEYAFEGFNYGICDDEPDYYDLLGIGTYPIDKDRREKVPKDFVIKLQESHEYFLHLNTNNTNNKRSTFRLYQIMMNIIRNNGTFVPTDLKIEKWKKKTK